MDDAPTPPNVPPRRELVEQMAQAGKQAEKLRMRAEALKKFAQRYMDSSSEQRKYQLPHKNQDP